MKKYRLTKITVKTREVISMSRAAKGEIQTSVCPVCHSPLAAILPFAEKQPAELASAEFSADQDQKLKGDL